MTTGPSGDLFPDFDFESSRVQLPERQSAARRRTHRQLRVMKFGQHPLALPRRVALRLHQDAPPDADRAAPGPRCGSCVHRQSVACSGGSRPKCTREASVQDDGRLKGPWMSYGAATDCRSWWPACRFWTARAGQPS